MRELRAGRVSLHLVSAAVLCVAVGQTASAAPAIQWQVDNPFRFFQYQSDFESQRWAYNELSDANKQNNPASTIERKLNDPRWWSQTGADGMTHLQKLNVLRQPEHRSSFAFEPRLGWASLLREDTNDTCWNATTQLYRDCESSTINVSQQSSYLDPVAHRVTAWVSGGSSGATCSWTADTPVFIRQGQGTAAATPNLTAACDAHVALLVPNEKPVQVTVTGDASGNASEQLLVHNLLIVGLGDSMASGEGNPDVPVRLDPGNGIGPGYDEQNILKKPAPAFRENILIPRRADPNAPALWIDRRCHRSVYSWQARTALAVALTGPQHRSVTYVSYACSGAQVLPGLLYSWAGRETIASLAPDVRRRLNRPQIDAVIDELCRDPAGPPSDYSFGVSLDANDDYVKSNGIPRDRVKLLSCPQNRMRPIDLLLVDIGVNDVSFSGIIAYMTVTNGSGHFPGQVSYSAAELRAGAGATDFTAADAKLARLKPRFEALHSVVKNRLNLQGNDESRVLFASYPSIVAATASGGLCPIGRATMTVSNAFQVQSEDVIKQAADFAEQGNSTMEQYAAPWTYVQSYRSKYVGHGYCAINAASPNESGKGTAEIVSMPYTTNDPGMQWLFFNPAVSLYPYESRGRWFRTFNDDYMIVNYSKTPEIPLKNPAQYNDALDLVLAATGGPMHPTAEGQSYIADGIIQAARAKLNISADGN